MLSAYFMHKSSVITYCHVDLNITLIIVIKCYYYFNHIIVDLIFNNLYVLQH